MTTREPRSLLYPGPRPIRAWVRRLERWLELAGRGAGMAAPRG